MAAMARRAAAAASVINQQQRKIINSESIMARNSGDRQKSSIKAMAAMAYQWHENMALKNEKSEEYQRILNSVA